MKSRQMGNTLGSQDMGDSRGPVGPGVGSRGTLVAGVRLWPVCGVLLSVGGSTTPWICVVGVGPRRFGHAAAWRPAEVFGRIGRVAEREGAVGYR